MDSRLARMIPEGSSYWEVGTSLDPRTKATSDYRSLTQKVPEDERQKSTFVFLSPLSAVRTFENTWEKDGQETWLKEKREDKSWKDIRLIDGTRLRDWLELFPAVGRWLAFKTLGVDQEGIETVDERWEILKSLGFPPGLDTGVFLASRDVARARLDEVFQGDRMRLRFRTRYPGDISDFVTAHVMAMPEQKRIEIAGRTLLVSSMSAWSALVGRKTQQILVGDAALNLSDDLGTSAIQRASLAGHRLVVSATDGGVPDPSAVALTSPVRDQLETALRTARFPEQRARDLAQKCGGVLASLKRVLQNLSDLPEWAQSSEAAELTIAMAIGTWNEASPADQAAIERIVGKAYGEWMASIRKVAARPNTPLTHHEGRWRFHLRFEGWYSLGPHLFDELLVRLVDTAIAVLTEDDPQFELPKTERYAAQIHGKVLEHSESLRAGLADFLALLGSHPSALSGCSVLVRQGAARKAVRAILGDASPIRWASINGHLPLLAEAAPDDFLAGVEAALRKHPSPFEGVFAEEAGGLFGATHMSGLLRALENLAWDPAYFNRTMLALGELASMDPGGKWANRPINTIKATLLPWLPQTLAGPDDRVAAVRTLLAEVPKVGWEVVLALLPRRHESSSYNNRPTWRDTIPPDWQSGVSWEEMFAQVKRYSEVALSAATRDPAKLVELVKASERLDGTVRTQLVANLTLDTVRHWSDADRFLLWRELSDLVARHRRFADAEWTIDGPELDEFAAAAERIAPQSLNLRRASLFRTNEFDLLDGAGSYDEQQRVLLKKRSDAITEICMEAGVEGVVAFALEVESPGAVGLAAGYLPPENTAMQSRILPALLDSKEPALSTMAAGFVWGRFRSLGFVWVDSLAMSGWSPLQVASFLGVLPFSARTWDYVEQRLGIESSLYWRGVRVSPHDADEALPRAVDQLLRADRPHAAIACLYWQTTRKEALSPKLAIEALRRAPTSAEQGGRPDTHHTVEIIRSLQSDSSVSKSELAEIEWTYLNLLDRYNHISPVTLENALADDPEFFCRVIQDVFKPRSLEAQPPLSEEQKAKAEAGYTLLHHWSVPPGMSPDRTFDGAQLASWLQRAQSLCRAVDRFEVAMHTVGQVLTHVPADPNGLFIHVAAAHVLNEKEADDLRTGFRIATLNSRGVFRPDPLGQQEDAQAARLRSRAADLDRAGFVRFAGTMREIADQYEREAEWNRTRDARE